MTPEQIERWFEANAWRLDGPAQWLGDEPNAVRKPWDSATVRWLNIASWPYFHSAGNQSLPAVDQAINDGAGLLADRCYLPETPRDMKILEKAGIPCHGIGSKHQALDFDVVGTSISYMVLFMNFCNTGDAPIWMGDLSFKPLAKVQVGDEVLGWEWAEGKPGCRPGRRLVRSTVKAIAARQAPVVKVTMESGKVIRCTPDHKWLAHQSTNAGIKQDSWTTVGGRSPIYGHRERKHARTVHLGTLSSVVELPPELTPEQQREADWLAGMLDGEGHANHIAQSLTHNPEICVRIERALTVLGIPFKTYDQKNGCRKFMMAGGRQTYVHWLNWTRGVKRAWFERQIMGRMMSHRDRVMKIEPDGVDTVYSMETGTGNYVAWGYASKNCKHLKLSGIPLRWAEREMQGLEKYPMVIVGGQAACAPGAMEPVADCIWIGEVEDEPGNPGGIQEVCSRIAEFKEEGAWSTDRASCYAALAREFNHLYFPRFTEVAYRYEDRSLPHLSRQVAALRPTLEGMAWPHRSRRVVDLDAIVPLRSAPLLYTQPGMGAGDIEVARSCPAWCGFCRLALTTKPYRQRSVGMSVEHAGVWLHNMGTVEVSPFGPDFPMYTRRKDLLAQLLEKISDEVDGTAMRIDDLIEDPDYVVLYTAGRATAVTLGLEGNSQRMRDLVGKGTSDKEVEEVVIRGIRAGISKFKFFMISQFPGEDEGDVMRIVRLGQRLDAIRTEFSMPNVRYQFSWTPLLIEAQTPFQWFAPTPPDHTLIKVIDELRPSRIDCKIGTKAEPNKVALFQLCQRASREVGEAIVDVLEKHAVASWGGVPRTIRDDLETALQAHGFRNGLADCFDERGRTDLFGWEHIDMGVSTQLLWNTYTQMVEFLQGTDSATYDDQVAGEYYHGQEWIGRCDTHCEGAACGACEPKDFRKRREYIEAGKTDRDITRQPVRPIDRSSVAMKIRLRLNIPQRYRYVTNDHWRFSIRRAAYRAEEALPAGVHIAKRSIVFASDAIKVRDWSYGSDYAELGLTQHVPSHHVQLFMSRLQAELGQWLGMPGYGTYGASLSLPPAAVSYYSLDLDTGQEEIAARLDAWDRAEAVPLVLAADTSYFGPGTAEVDAKELIKDLWVLRHGHQLQLRFLAHGKAGPYQLAAAFLGMPSHLALQRRNAVRKEWFGSLDGTFYGQPCPSCGGEIPQNLLGESLPDCPKCLSLTSDKAVMLLPASVIGR